MIDNTPEEITDVVMEMDARLNGTWKADKEEEDLHLGTLSLTTWLAPEANGGGYESPFSGRSGATDNDYTTGVNIDQTINSSADFRYLNIEKV